MSGEVKCSPSKHSCSKSVVDRFYYSPLTKPAIFFRESFMAARHKKGAMNKSILKHFLVCKVLSNDDVEVARGTVRQQMRPGAGVKTGDFVKEKLGWLP